MQKRRWFQRLRIVTRTQAGWTRAMNSPWGKAGLILCFALVAFALTAKPSLAALPTDWVDDLILGLAGIILAFASIIGSLTLEVLNVLIQVVMPYNGFSTSPVVSAGWAIVRDTVNMFFVIVLIIIAFGTILGVSRFKWQQQVPKLLIAAIVINFSRTIAGIMIDMGQVVMLTFATALRDIAGGNFVQLFQLNSQFTLSNSSSVATAAASGSAPAVTLGAWDYLGASVGSFIMLGIVFVVVVLLVAVLAYRIVMLWVLVTISPIAFFLGGIRDLAPAAGNGYSKWWSRFTCMVVIGPVLTFFLWLALAVAGAGNLAVSEGFTSASAGGATGQSLTSAFEVTPLTSFIIGIALIFAGLEAAMEFCAQDGFISSAVGKAKGAAKFVAAAPVAGAAIAGGYAARLGLRGGRAVAGGAAERTAGYVANKTGISRASLYSTLEKKGPGFLKATASRGRIRAEARTAAAAKESEKKFDGLDTQGLGNLADRYTGNKATSVAGRKEGEAFFAKVMQDEKLQAQLESTGQLQKLYDNYGKDAAKSYGGDDDMSSKIRTFGKKNAHILGDDAIAKIDSDDVKDLSEAALADERVQKHIKDKKLRNIKGVEYAELLAKGSMGRAKQDAFVNGRAALYRGADEDDLADVPIDQIMNDKTSDETLRDLVIENPNMAAKLISSGDAKVKARVSRNKELRDALLLQSGVKDVATGEMDKEKNGAERFKRLIQSNPSAIGMFEAGDLNGEAAEVAADALDDTAIGQIAKEYRKADTGKRAEMKPMIQNVSEMLRERGTVATGKAASMLESEVSAVDAAADRPRQRAARAAEASTAKTEASALKNAPKRLEGLKADLSKAEGDLVNVGLQLEEAQEQVAEAELAALAGEAPTVDFKKAEANVAKYQAQMETLQGKIDQNIEDIRAENTRVDELIAEQQEKRDDLQAIIAAAGGDADLTAGLQEELDGINESISELEAAKLARVGSAPSRASSGGASSGSAAPTSRADLIRQLNDANTRLVSAQADLARAQTAGFAAREQQLNQEIDRLRAQIQDLSNRV